MNKKDLLFGVICWLALPAIGIFALFGAVRCFGLVEKYVYPVIFVWFLALIFPGLLTACFRKTRGWTAMAMFWWSYVFAGYLWLDALTVVVLLWGWFWAAFGLLLAGLGVFPIALIALGWHGEWGMFWSLALNIVLFWIVRLAGIWLMTKCPDYDPDAI
jgi:hypothetical protein